MPHFPTNESTLRFSVRALICLMAFCLSGCVRFKSRPLAASHTAEEFDARSLTNPELRTFLERNLGREFDTWPVPFDLTHIILSALYYNPDMDVARAKWAVLQAGKRIAAERPNPTLSVSPGYDTTTSIPSPWLATASLDIPIETAGKRGYRIAQAAQLSEAARLNVLSAAWAVRSRARQRFVDFYFARETEHLLKEQQGLQQESLRMVEAQFEAGAISAFERTQARIGAENIRFLLRDAERQSVEARAQLADAIGVPLRALDDVQLSFESLAELPKEIPGEQARRNLLLTRPDLLALLAEYAASQAALQLEIAKQYPDIHLSPGYEFDQGDNKWSIGVGVTLPILNHNQGAIGEAIAKRSEAAANFAALQAHAISEIDRALVSYRLALQKATEADSLRTSLLKQEKSLHAMLEAGDISKSDMIGIQLQLSASSLTRLDAISKARQAFGLLEDALQQPSGIPRSSWESSIPKAGLNHVTQP
jgi:cobalt-zinc-cadmium efflux system outer membrane protein